MHTFNVAALKPFDTLLVRFDDDDSKKIRASCNSDYSHAVVYIGNSSFVEGNYPVVTLFSAQRYFFNSLNDVKVIRLKSEFEAQFDVQKAESSIRGLVYRNYEKRLLYLMSKQLLSQDIKDIFLNEYKWTGGIVCTSMVALPYFVGGIDISQTNEPFYVNFGGIERSDYFEDVTQLVFDEVETSAVEGLYDYLSSFETGSILEKQAVAVGKLNKVVKDIYAKHITGNTTLIQQYGLKASDLQFSTWEGIYPFIMHMFLTQQGKEFDEIVYNELVSSGYLNLWFEEAHSNPDLYFPAYYVNAHKYTQDPISHFEAIKSALIETLERNEANMGSLLFNFLQCPCKTFHAQLAKYAGFIGLLRLSIDNYTVMVQAAQNGEL